MRAKSKFMSAKEINVSLCYQLDDSVPEWIELIAAGKNNGFDGRVFYNYSPDLIVDRFNESGLLSPIDIEHSTQIRGSEGLSAPAVGWITRMENRNGAVFGHVQWNAAAKKYIEGREYKYYSPALSVEDENKVVGIVSVGLTNVPNLALTALNKQLGDTMPFSKKVLDELGLAEDATEEQVLEKLAELRQPALKDKEVVTPSIDPAKEGYATEQSVELNSAIAKHPAFVALQKQVGDLVCELNKTKWLDAEKTVDGYIAQGKVLPSERDLFVFTMKHDPDKTNKLLSTRTAVALNTRITPDEIKAMENDPVRARVKALYGDKQGAGK